MSTKVCNESDIPVNGVKCFKVSGESILVYHLEDGFYATQSKCTHLFKGMEKGKIVDGNIRCPLHRAEFDIKTGEVAKWANFPPGIQLMNALRKEKALQTYNVSVEDGEVFLNL